MAKVICNDSVDQTNMAANTDIDLMALFGKYTNQRVTKFTIAAKATEGTASAGTLAIKATAVGGVLEDVTTDSGDVITIDLTAPKSVQIEVPLEFIRLVPTGIVGATKYTVSVVGE